MTAEAVSRPTIWEYLVDARLEQAWVDAAGVSTRVLRAGKRGNPPLLFLHGTTGHVETYARNLAEHAKYFDCIAIDMVGHGLTGKPEQNYEIPDYAKHVADTLDALGLETVMITGQSLGGWVAAEFALRYPGRVTRLCLNTTGGAHSDPQSMKSILEKTMAAAQNPTREIVRKRLEFLMSDPSSVTEELVSCRQHMYQQPGMLEATRRILCLQDPEVRARNVLADERWAQIAVPTLVLWTTDDPTAPPRVGERIAAAIQGSRFVLMERCGHWPQWESPEEFNSLHIAFMRGEAVSPERAGA